jgi:3-oxoacyl-[acyl-carrier protein] reductase
MLNQRKSILITGSTKGIGNAIAHKFAANNYNLILIARSDKDLQEQKKNLMVDHTIDILCISADLSEKRQIQKILDILNENSINPDIIVNNLGVYQPSTIFDEDDIVMEKMMNINYYSGYYLTKALLTPMLERNSGHIFSICSVANINPVKQAFAYTISKYAVYGFIKSLRESLIETDIKTTAIIPGSTLTASWDGTTVDSERFIMADDIAEAIFMAANLSKGACLEEIIIRPQHGQIT